MSRSALKLTAGGPAGWLDALVRAGQLFADERRRTLLAAALLAVNLVLLAMFLFVSYKGFFHSDSAVRVLLAQEMHETGRFFPAGWNYVNKDLMILFAQLGVWPLQFFQEGSYTLYALAGVAVAAVILGSVWWFSGLLGGSTWQRVLALAVLAGGVSASIEEDIFGQAAYGILLTLSCLLAVLTWKSMAAVPRRRPVWWALLFVLVLLCTWSNPQRAAATYLLPLYCGLAAYWWGGEWRSRAHASVPVVVATVLGFVIGAGLSVWTLTQVNNNAGVGAAHWLDFNAMAGNLVHTAHGLVALLGGLPAAGGTVISAQGIYAAMRLLAALILLVLMGRTVLAFCRSASAQARFVGGMVAGLAACFLFLHVTTTVADMNDPVSVARYLAPATTLALLLVICAPLQHASRLGAVLMVGLSLLLASNSVVRFNPGSMIHPGWQNPQRDALVAELKAMGLKYGYATYWNAGALTVLSGGDVKIRQVEVFDGLPVPMRHLSSDHWYEPEAWQGETFLLLTDQEAASLNWGSLTRYAGQPVREARIGDKRVIVFKQNLALDVPGWSAVLRKPLRIDAAPDGSKTVGRWVGSTQSLKTFPGETGYLQFGPYTLLGRGTYRVTFDVVGRADAPQQVVALVDVVAAGGTQVLGSKEVRGDGSAQHIIEFRLDKPVATLEMRVAATGAGEVTYQGVTLSAAH
ncbi:hypothetical protein [Stenotrophomonas sp.]|uniref:hypothetical protein n=1 Tax=Stenotrophomonas sp. TaxID=69392 RepID=UPI002D727222|nr:hypothetical protein [Stenotrophomonas sp.]HYQ23620.1 hypothetical protein [Stenotrophomonas sp.]